MVKSTLRWHRHSIIWALCIKLREIINKQKECLRRLWRWRLKLWVQITRVWDTLISPWLLIVKMKANWTMPSITWTKPLIFLNKQKVKPASKLLPFTTIKVISTSARVNSEKPSRNMILPLSSRKMNLAMNIQNWQVLILVWDLLPREWANISRPLVIWTRPW